MRQESPNFDSHQVGILAGLVKRAGDQIMAVYRQPFIESETKADDSPVTQADVLAHHSLVADLHGAFQHSKVVSEEDAASLVYRRADSGFWLIDPLDGTKEFLSRSGEFTVNVAWVEQGVAVWGMVYAPALHSLYWGGAGLGAWRESGGSVTALHVSESSARHLRVVASKSHLDAQTSRFIDALPGSSLLQAGSSLKFCRVAEGLADVYPRMGPTCEWDTAAAQAVLEGAGGVVLDLGGKPLRYGKPDVLNPSFIAAASPALARVPT